MTDRAGGPRRPADSGVTLVELLVTIAITGILMTSLSAGIVAVVRTMGPTAKRLAATQDEQNLVTWLPVDVSSTPVSSLRTAADAASGCAGGAPGVNVLLASWSETVNGTTTSYETSYRAVTEGAGMRLKRFTCKGNGALGTASAMNVSNVLAPLPAGWTAGTAPIVVTVTGVVVQVTLTQDDGRINSVDAASKNPAASLPPSPTAAPTTATTTTVPTTTTTVPTTTTTVPTTTVAGGPVATELVTTTAAATTTTTIPCVVTSVTVTPSAAATHSKAPNQLQNDVVVTMTKTGPCQLLQLQYDTRGSQGLMYQNFTDVAPYTVTLRGFKTGGSEIWAAGDHLLTVIDNTKNVLAAATLTVT